MNNQKNVAVVNAIFGGIDARKEIPGQSIPFNSYFFSEENCFHDECLSDRNKALYFKSQAHKLLSEEIIIWVDGKIQILSYDFIQQCLDALGDGQIAMQLHPASRNCVYQEENYIQQELGKNNPYIVARYSNRSKLLKQQVLAYALEGYPENNGLHDACIIVRRNSHAINKMLDHWWINCRNNYYDQIDIEFLAWVYQIPIKTITFKPTSFKQVQHLLVK